MTLPNLLLALLLPCAAPSAEEVWSPELVALEKQAVFVESFGERFLRFLPGVDFEAVTEQLEAAEHSDGLVARTRALSQVSAALEGDAWGDFEQLRYGLALRADRRLLEAPGVVTLRLERLFEVAAPGEYHVRIQLDESDDLSRLRRGFGRARVDEDPETLLEAEGVELSDPLPTFEVTLPEEARGEFFLTLTLRDTSGQVGRLASAPRLAIRPPLLKQAAALSARIEAIEARPAAARPAAADLAMARYPLELVASLNAGRIGLAEANLPAELAAAGEIVAAMEKGEDPQPLPGLARRVHRLAATGETLPYKIFVPSSYDPQSETPLVVALHGLGAREDSYFLYGGGLLQKEAEARGMLVVAPLGHRVDGWYANVSELDVLAVLGKVREEYNVDAGRIYLTGHSMGGFGSFALAARHPELFAAIAPVAGGGDPLSVPRFQHVPMFVVHGDADAVVPVAMSRAMVEAARAADAEVEYVEIEGGDHLEIVAMTIPRMFDFFEAH